jgi:hypothetical protein
MRRVRILVSISGSAYSLRPGEETELDDAEAGRLVAAGFAAPVEASRPTTPEDASSRAARDRERAVSIKHR